MMGNIKFEKCPLYPVRFDILEIQSKKKNKTLAKGALSSAPFIFCEQFLKTKEVRVDAMIRKKKRAKSASRTVAKKAKAKKGPRTKKHVNSAEVRNDIAKIVKSGAKKITKAVMEQAMTGQLAPAKYLFEVAAIYPPASDGSEASTDEECFAQTLLKRLDIPDKPIALDDPEDEAGKVAESDTDASDAESESEKEPVASAAGVDSGQNL